MLLSTYVEDDCEESFVAKQTIMRYTFLAQVRRQPFS